MKKRTGTFEDLANALIKGIRKMTPKERLELRKGWIESATVYLYSTPNKERHAN